MGWTGYKAHLTETRETDPLHVITNVQTTAAIVDNAAMTGLVHRHLDQRPLAPDEHVTDAGYVTAAHIWPPATTTASPCSARSAWTPTTVGPAIPARTCRSGPSPSTGADAR